MLVFTFQYLCFLYSIPVFYTMCGKIRLTLVKKPVANLMRHKPSGNYYARIRVGGKLI